METALARFLQPGIDPFDALVALAGRLRPGRGQTDTAIDCIEQLTKLLDTRPDLRDGLRQALLQLFGTRHAVLLLATSGVYPETGVVAETLRRISHKVLPEVDDEAQLKDAVARVFRRADAAWLETIPAETWGALIRALDFDGARDREGIGRLIEDLLEALRVVAHRVAAAGLEPEMLRLDPSLENHASPFLALCEEALALALAVEGDSRNEADERHLLVLIDQARESIERVRRRAQFLGASFHLTFRLRRLAQHL
ncbi:MAG: preprotein translocase subunit TatB, partial [Rhodocyclaceae bacterium]|nr:preprotein translocase subunit TatB [Rhodocyclaceae bacterium]